MSEFLSFLSNRLIPVLSNPVIEPQAHFTFNLKN